MLCQLFLKKLGISPFMKFHESQNVIGACIKGCQYDLLKYLIEDSRKGAREKCGYVKYEFDGREIRTEQLNYYWKSRQNKDQNGNNSCHLTFEIVDEKLRYKFLNLLLSEEIGNMNKPNLLGFLPHEIEHHQPIPMRGLGVMPVHVYNHLSLSRQEEEEADYCIITPKDKKDIVIMQLDDLKAKNRADDNISWVVHDFEAEEIDKVAALLKCGICWGKHKYMTKKRQTAIVIKFP